MTSHSQVEVRDTFVVSGGAPLAVRVHRRAGAGSERPPTVVVTGSWLTVKEQMADLYASRLAAQGLTAVTFDPAGFGASGGVLRQTESPVGKMRDLAAVVDHLATLSFVDSSRCGVLAVCASAQYTLGALARGLPVASFVSVAGWYHDTASVAPFYGGVDGVEDKLARASRAAAHFARTGELTMVPAYGPGDPTAGMSMELDYYADPARGAVEAWDNRMSEMSWSHWLTFDAFAALPQVRVPTLIVHGDDAVLPDNARRVGKALGDAATMVWTEGAQTDFYDRPAQVDLAVGAAVDHFAATMPPSGGAS
jgi:fermentation-respiration switch protein FrsA (DUF1100 family)